jgi:uncharacterized protein DUF4956
MHARAHLAELLAAFQGDGAPLDPLLVLRALGVSLVSALWVRFVYGRCATRPNRTLGSTLCALSLVTTLVILPVRHDVTLSLGMVGALSIVRFRAAIKDPLDVAFLFWAIAVGVADGAGFYEVALLGGALVGLSLLALRALPLAQREPLLLVLRLQPDAEAALALLPRHRLRSRTQTRDQIEVVAEISGRVDGELLTRLLAVDGVRDAQLVRVLPDA